LQERDLIVAVLAAQAGFVTPSEVLAAAAAGLVDAAPDSLLTRLEQSGVLNMERRKLLETLVEQTLAARNGDARAVLTSMGGATGVIETLVSSVAAATPRNDGQPGAGVDVPLERPGQYTRLGELGRGSQSIVRVARDEIVGRDVALKELVATALPATDGSSRAARARFLREVRLVAGLDHPGIVAILELARREDGTLFCAQKLIRGENLQSKIARCRSLADRLGLVRYVLDACQAMGFAHSKNVIHRDLKPSNVMVGEYGETVVVDWGLAKRQEEAEEVAPLAPASAEPSLTVAGAALGTPAYMSPEQARGDLPAIDARSDVFSLGAILYQVLTGRPPFEGVDSDHVLENVRAGRFPPVLTMRPEAPPELAAIAERALQPEPSRRYRDAEELARELSAYLAGGRVRAYQYGAWELLRKFASGHRSLTAGLAVGIGALLLSAVVVAIRLQAARRDLASAFIERAYAAEREADWAQAAAYFAAARAQHDTPEARWGVALAGERAPERILSKHGPAESFIDVDVLPDGRLIALGYSSSGVGVREVESGKTLWSYASEPVLGARFLPGGQVRLGVRGSLVFHDAATGKQLGRYDRNTVGWPCPGPYPPPAFIQRGQLLLRSEEGPPRPIATTYGLALRCVVSDDGRQVAYQDGSGMVQLLAVEDERKLASRPGAGLRDMLFSRHGLVLVKLGRLEVFGGPEGDFTIELPGGGFGDSRVQIGPRVSPDGHLVAVPRLGSSRSDVVDLRSRSLRGTLTHAPGWARLAFSHDGQRVFAADLRNGATLSGWRLPPPEVPTTHAGSWQTPVSFSSSGRRLYVGDLGTSHYELYGPGGELLARHPGPLDTAGIPDFAGGGPVGVSWDRRKDETVVSDLEQGRVLWARPCRFCIDVGISADGSRVVHTGPLDRLEVWDTKANRLLFKEVERVGPRADAHCALSPDGRRVAWSQGRKVIVRDLDSGREWTVPLGGDVRGLRFSPDSAGLASGTTGSIARWDAATGRLLWSVINGVPDGADLHWSADGHALLLDYDTLGTELFDARTGEKLARFLVGTASVSPTRVYLQPDLRAKVVITPTHWERRPLPEPAAESPDRSLARTLERTGLALQGVEVVAAP